MAPTYLHAVADAPPDLPVPARNSVRANLLEVLLCLLVMGVCGLGVAAGVTLRTRACYPSHSHALPSR